MDIREEFKEKADLGNRLFQEAIYNGNTDPELVFGIYKTLIKLARNQAERDYVESLDWSG
ncbi:MAG: hypothetical protein FWD58_03065 [Firmicutes bacterium]|nr:hypothetical protein [Bacillota bacterium]